MGERKANYSRRDLGRLAAGAAALAAGGGAKGQGAKPMSDARLERLEKERGKPLSDEQRKAVLQNMADIQDAWSGARSYKVPDGTEPNFIFHPRRKDDSHE